MPGESLTDTSPRLSTIIERTKKQKRSDHNDHNERSRTFRESYDAVVLRTNYVPCTSIALPQNYTLTEVM